MSTTAGGFGLDAVSETIVRGELQLALNTWAHLAFTYDGQTLRLYENGALVSSLAWSGSIPLSNGALRIGGNGQKGEYFAGLIDEVRVYDRALSAAEIQGDMSAAIGLPAPSDTEPPTVPQGMAWSGATQTTVGLAWDASTDNVGVAGYNLYRNGVQVASTQNLSYTFTGLTCGTTYTFALEAYDAAGNASDRAQATGTTSTSPCAVSDTQPPSVPDGMAWSGTTQTTVGLVWNASSDNVGVAGYRLYKDGAVDGTTTNLSYSFTGLTCGTTYTFALEAYDAAGNASNRAAATGTTSTSPCSSGDTQAPTAPANLTKTGATATSISITWAASSDNVGVTGYGLYRDGAGAGSTTSLGFTFTGLSCGSNYLLGVDAGDAAGNRSTRSTLSAATSACAPPPSGGATVFVSTTGSDANACTQAAPCRSLDRGYRVADPGDVVEVAGGSYPSQRIGVDSTKTSATDVLIRPAAGATVSVSSLYVDGKHLEIQGLRFPSFPGQQTTETADDVTFRNTKALRFGISGRNISVIGGDFGPSDNLSNEIAPSSPSSSQVPTNILIEGNTIHGFHQTDGQAHVDCIHSWGANTFTIRNNRMYDCEHFNILFNENSILGAPTNVLIENNFLSCCRSGSYSFYLGNNNNPRYQNITIRNNSADKAMGIGTSAGTVSGIFFYSNIAPRLDDACGRTGVTADYNDWYAGAKCGANDFVAPPGYRDAANLDFHLVAGSAAINRGHPTNFPATDIDMQVRPMGTRADAGADEAG
jgi:chitodextrinase